MSLQNRGFLFVGTFLQSHSRRRSLPACKPNSGAHTASLVASSGPIMPQHSDGSFEKPRKGVPARPSVSKFDPHYFKLSYILPQFGLVLNMKRRRLALSIMRRWVTFGILTLQASLSLAADLPETVTHATFPRSDMSQVLLGHSLFYDPILSGNQDIACATCHHPTLGSSDGMSLSLGAGAKGLGPERVLMGGQLPQGRVPRNAPALWNLGAREFELMFHDGRVAKDPDAPFGILMPQDRPLDRVMPSPLAAQAMLPVLSAVEMAGQPGSNPVADAVAERQADLAWALLAERVNAIPDYRRRFDILIGADQAVHFSDIASAIAAFITYEFRATNSRFDAYLNGDEKALPQSAKRGLELFYGAANCASCHSGLFQTDHGFHAIGLPQLGPGKDAKLTPYADFGRHSVTGIPEDLYRFRTPSLRNIALTAPYGHSGAYATLEAVVRHHLEPNRALLNYDRTQAVLHDVPLDDWKALNDEVELFEIAASIELPAQSLTDQEVDDILAFLNALTDPGSKRGRLGVPDNVPSGLPVDR